jgi:hypothetical protein
MCGCGKKKVAQTYVPQFRQVLVKDRLGKIIIQKVPIPPRRPQKRNMPKKIIPNIQPKLIDEINSALPRQV